MFFVSVSGGPAAARFVCTYAPSDDLIIPVSLTWRVSSRLEVSWPERAESHPFQVPDEPGQDFGAGFCQNWSKSVFWCKALPALGFSGPTTQKFKGKAAARIAMDVKNKAIPITAITHRKGRSGNLVSLVGEWENRLAMKV